MSITFKDNSREVFAKIQNAKSAALIKIGIAAKHNAQDIIVEKDIIDTKQLHNTMDWGSNGVVGKTPTDSVDIGSPKNYAVFNELGTIHMRARPFLEPAIMNNIGEYKDIVASVMGSEFGTSVGGLTSKSQYYGADPRVTNI